MAFEVKRILFPTDLSDNSRHAFRHAAEIANRYGAGIVLFHVAEGLTEKFKKRIISYMGEDVWNKIKSDREKDVRDILIGKHTERRVLGQVLRQMTDDLQADSNVAPFETDEIVIAEGNIPEAILKAVRGKNCDLIVMASQGDSVIPTAAPGGITKNLLKRARIPVLVVPSPDN